MLLRTSSSHYRLSIASSARWNVRFRAASHELHYSEYIRSRFAGPER